MTQDTSTVVDGCRAHGKKAKQWSSDLCRPRSRPRSALNSTPHGTPQRVRTSGPRPSARTSSLSPGPTSGPTRSCFATPCRRGTTSKSGHVSRPLATGAGSALDHYYEGNTGRARLDLTQPMPAPPDLATVLNQVSCQSAPTSQWKHAYLPTSPPCLYHRSHFTGSPDSYTPTAESSVFHWRALVLDQQVPLVLARIARHHRVRWLAVWVRAGGEYRVGEWS